MTTALVTGGAGFLGSHVCEKLLRDGYRVIAVDNLLTGSEENFHSFRSDPHFSFLQHDVTKPLPEDVHAEMVFHLASPASPNHHSKISYLSLPMETMMVNTVGTHHLLEFADLHQARFLFTSTSEIYGDPLEHPQKEDYRGNVSPIGPRSVYDESKRFGETLVSYYIRERQLDGRIARIFNSYGPRMQREDMRMIANFIQQALVGKPITVFGDGSQTRSLCFVTDTVDGIVKLMHVDKAAENVVNVGSDEEHTVLEYAELVKRLTNSSSEIVMSEALPKDDPVRRRPDITKARELLGWEPKVGLEEGLLRLIDYLKELN